MNKENCPHSACWQGPKKRGEEEGRGAKQHETCKNKPLFNFKDDRDIYLLMRPAMVSDKPEKPVFKIKEEIPTLILIFINKLRGNTISAGAAYLQDFYLPTGRGIFR
jgi:hypothetical protein